MAFLLSTTHHLLAFDGKQQFFQVHSGKGLYYGLAQHSGRIYVACRNQTQGPDDATVRTRETGSILLLDATTLQAVAELRPEFPMRDLHGIAYFDNKLWATCSFDNLVAVFDAETRNWAKWYPAADPAARDCDTNHFNTIVPLGEHIALLAHNKGPSQVLFYDRLSLELCSVLELGRAAHDIFPAGGGIATCSSADGLLVGSTGWALRTGAFPRGIAYNEDSILLGLSQMAPRAIRHEKSSIVRRFTLQWHHVADYVLPSVGMILAMLPVNLDLDNARDLEPFEAHYFPGEYSSLEPGNVYPASSTTGVFAPEWHASEGTHRWTAARESRIRIVVNPGERSLFVSCWSAFPGQYWTEILLNGETLGYLHWPHPGSASSQFPLPPDRQGTCEIVFRVPHLWQPSRCLSTEDQRRLGIAVQELKLLNSDAGFPIHRESHSRRG